MDVSSEDSVSDMEVSPPNMAVYASDISVEIEGIYYSLKEIPNEKSAVVLAEQKHLIGIVDLESLVMDLSRVGGFIRIAYNGVGAAGPKFTDQQIEIQELGYDIVTLCSNSAQTVYNFKKASKDILDELLATYAYLLGNLEELAVTTLSSISTVAKKMQEEALKLTSDFENEGEKVKATLKKTQREKGKQAENIQSKKNERTELEEAKKRVEQTIEEKTVKKKQAELRRRELEFKEDEAVACVGNTISFIEEFIKAFDMEKHEKTVFSADGPAKRAEAVKKQRLEALEEEQASQQQYREAIAKMILFATQIEQCKTEEDMADCAVNALHYAAGALKQLSLVMCKAAQFWQQMQEHFFSLNGLKVKSVVTTALTYPKDERLRVWTSDGFKIQAIKFYAQWVAVGGVCSVYTKQIKETQEDLNRCISENPTWEQSRENFKQLTSKFLSDLQQDQKAISEKSFQTQEEINDLTEA